MRHKVIQNKTGFEPVTIEITIESRDELVDMWKRLNLGSYVVDQEHKDSIYSLYDSRCENTYSLWKSLDDILKEKRFGE